jgi:hypothetical protein
LVNKICLDNSILSNSESCDGYPFNLQQFRDLILPRSRLRMRKHIQKFKFIA